MDLGQSYAKKIKKRDDGRERATFGAMRLSLETGQASGTITGSAKNDIERGGPKLVNTSVQQFYIVKHRNG